jgi:hypothetical protein
MTGFVFPHCLVASSCHIVFIILTVSANSCIRILIALSHIFRFLRSELNSAPGALLKCGPSTRRTRRTALIVVSWSQHQQSGFYRNFVQEGGFLGPFMVLSCYLTLSSFFPAWVPSLPYCWYRVEKLSV